MSNPYELDPGTLAWADQFGALIRDKTVQMQAAVLATGWNSIAHVFTDHTGEDPFQITYEDGEYMLTNLNDPAGTIIILNLEALGVNT